MTTAACKGVDTNLFFTRDTESSAMGRRRAVRLANTYCRNCPIRKACDAEADRRKEPGLWGGFWRIKDPKEYRKIPLLSYLPHYDTKKAS